MASSTGSGFCDDAAESRNTIRLPCTRRVRIGKSAFTRSTSKPPMSRDPGAPERVEALCFERTGESRPA